MPVQSTRRNQRFLSTKLSLKGIQKDSLNRSKSRSVNSTKIPTQSKRQKEKKKKQSSHYTDTGMCACMYLSLIFKIKNSTLRI